jgi:hypothetical protein
MPNMSYCRWENTLNDMRDCAEQMEEVESFDQLNLSSEESLAFTYMFNLIESMKERMDQLCSEI